MALIRKYQASASALHLRWPDHHHDASNLVGFGFTTWPRLVTMLGDAARGDTLAVVERTIARHTLAWCDGLACVA